MARQKRAKKVKKKTVKKKRAAAVKKKKTAARGSKKKPKRKKSLKRKPAARKSARKKQTVKQPKSLGRPRVTADAKLDQVFQKDYQAREIFEFLGVTTIRELEVHAPAEIVERLTAPMVQTVERIRKTLAMVNRSLANDRRFALAFKAKLESRR